MKAQLLGKLNRYRIFLQQKLPIPDIDGEYLSSLNFDFEDNANQFLNEQQSEEQIEAESSLLRSKLKSTSLEDQMLIDAIKLTDSDLEPLLLDLGKYGTFEGELRFGGHNITDQATIIIYIFSKTLIRVASLLKEGVRISAVSFRNSPKLSYIGAQEFGKIIKHCPFLKNIDFHNCALGDIGVNQLIECISDNQNIIEYSLGMISNEVLKYLSTFLSRNHFVRHLRFQEGNQTKFLLLDLRDPWQAETKELFLQKLRYNIESRKILSCQVIDIENIEKHATFIGQLEILTMNNRKAYLDQQSNDFKAKELDTEHPEYYNPDDFKQNAFKFSVKSYLHNVFESLLDEGLFYLEKERQNVLRDEEIQKVTHEFQAKQVNEDICTADGSIMVLAKYLMSKTKK